MAALELELDEEEERDRLLHKRAAATGSASSRSGSESNNGSLIVSLSSRTSHSTLLNHHNHHHHHHHHPSSSSHQQRQRIGILLSCIPAALLLFLAARSNNGSSSSMLIDPSYSSSYPSPPLPPSLPLFNHTFATYLTSGLTKILDANNGITKHYIYDSPYEQRFPESKQPYWARKTIPFNKRIKREQQICLVHVGKAGGSTLGCMLGFSLHCDDDGSATSAKANSNTNNSTDRNDDDKQDDDDEEEEEEDNDEESKKTAKVQIKGLLPIATTHVFHRGVNDCADVNAYYLFVVRDPLARILSAFNYERPNMTKTVRRYKNAFMGEELYEKCGFWTLEQLAQGGLLNRKEDDSSMMCQSRAYKAITGVGGYLCHGYFNYQYYAQSVFGTQDAVEGESVVPENANLLVIRNEHIVDDWNRINLMIGGDSDDAIQSSDIPMNNAHAKKAEDIFLSDDSKDILCQVLCNEIQVYKDIIQRAVNLNREDVTTSMEELRKTCPKEAAEEVCSQARPNFQNRIEEMKGEQLIERWLRRTLND